MWPASRLFLDVLQTSFHDTFANAKSVIELGSGCGWLGMTIAQKFPSVNVTLTEQASSGGLHWLKHNVQLNPSIRVEAAELDWRNVPNEIVSRSWSVVIGCELVYSYEGATLLPNVIFELLRDSVSSNCYYAHTLNRFPTVDERLIEEFSKQSLMYDVVYGEAAFLGRAASQTELFPDTQLVVFRIRRS